MQFLTFFGIQRQDCLSPFFVSKLHLSDPRDLVNTLDNNNNDDDICPGDLIISVHEQRATLNGVESTNFIVSMGVIKALLTSPGICLTGGGTARQFGAHRGLGDIAGAGPPGRGC